MAKGSAKDKLFKDALIMIDKIYETDLLTTEESKEALNDLRLEINVRINLLKDVEKVKEGEK